MQSNSRGTGGTVGTSRTHEKKGETRVDVRTVPSTIPLCWGCLVLAQARILPIWGEFLKRGEKGEEKKELEIFQEGRTHNQFQISSSLFGTKFSLGLVFLGLVHERHYPVGPSRHDARMNN